MEALNGVPAQQEKQLLHNGQIFLRTQVDKGHTVTFYVHAPMLLPYNDWIYFKTLHLNLKMGTLCQMAAV